MRFILSFVFFGLLFYGLYIFFPEFFATLVSWAASVFNFFGQVGNKVNNSLNTP